MRRLWIAIAIILVLLVTFFVWQKKRTDKAKQPKSETINAAQGNIEVKVLSTGTVQPYTRVEARSSLRGRIDRAEVNEGNKVKKGDVLAWVSSEDRIALLDAARSALESANKEKNEEAIKAAKQAYEMAGNAYKPFPITTSISGEVIKRSCEPGQNISLDDILFVLSDRLVASVEVDEADIGMIKLGLEAWIVLDAFPNERVKAKVTKISLEGRIVSDVVIYDVMVDAVKVPSYWSSGMTANVEFILESKKDILIIPVNAVHESGNKKYVMVLKDKPEPREIKTGLTDRKMIEVTEGLNQGETVILGGIKNNSWQPNAINRSMHLMERH